MIIDTDKNVAYEVALPMVDKAAPESFKTGETVTDTAFSKDGAGAWTALAITDTFTEIGATGVYELSLTAAELNHDYVFIKLTATNSADSFIWFKLQAAGWDDVAAILDDTAEIGAAGVGLTNLGGMSATMKAQVNTEADAAIVTYGLDHMLAAAVVGADVVDNSIIALMLSKSATADFDSFNNTTDSLEAISDEATPSAVENAIAVWDRILSGATHNIVNSAGRILRFLKEAGGYQDGAIWIDTINGTAGTDDFENGTVSNPVLTMADANTLAASLGIRRFHIVDGSSITFAASQAGDAFFGDGWTLALAGKNVAGITVEGATITGIMGGVGSVQTFRDCRLGVMSVIKGTHFVACNRTGTMTVIEAGDIFFQRSQSGIAGLGAPVFDFGTAIGDTSLNVRGCSGGWQLESMGDTGTDVASLEGWGQLVEGTCTGGVVAIRGHFTVSGITNLTLSDDARYDVQQVYDNSETRLRDGIAQAGGAMTITLDAAASATDDLYKNAIVAIVAGTGAGQGNTIDNYVGATKVATMTDTWAVNPDATSEFVVLPLGNVPGASAPAASTIAAAVHAYAGYPDGRAFSVSFEELHAKHRYRVEYDRTGPNVVVYDYNDVELFRRRITEVSPSVQAVVPQ